MDYKPDLFLYIDECVHAISTYGFFKDFHGPVNIGSEEMVSINHLAQTAIDISGKNLTIKNNPEYTFTGVRGRNSDNTLIREKLGINPFMSLEEGMKITYNWIMGEI